MRNRWWLVPLIIPPAFTALTLARVALDRRDVRGPTVLTQRDYTLSRSTAENTATSVRLNWQPAPPPPDTWFDREKLRELGFDVSVDPARSDAERRYGQLLSRDAFVVFEVRDTPSVPSSDGRVGPESRLVPVDAGRDADVLAARYQDSRRFLITAASVRAVHQTRGGRPYVTGSILNVDPSRIHVPPTLAGSRAASFEIVLGYSRRWEPVVLELDAN
jgi:hypothetical protein